MCRRYLISGILLGACVAPAAAHAAVVIHEVAWMGTTVSANAEWLELANTEAEAVNLSGFTLVSSSGSPSITLTGTIAGNGYYLLERTSDSSVPDVSADQIYSGALPNTGVTLVLKDATGTVIDTVNGGTDWKTIGGDNTTKHTAQRSGSLWSTAPATPRAQNTSGSTSAGDTSTATSTDPLTPQPSVSGSPVTTGSSKNPIPRLYIDAGPGRIVTVGAEVPFTARAYDSDGSIRKDARLDWNFGDGMFAQGDDVIHVFQLVGTYTVAVHAHAGESDVVSVLTVRADPSQARIHAHDSEGITLKNEGDTILDLSFWQLGQGDARFTLPRYTVLMPGQESRFPNAVTGVGTSTLPITLHRPDGRVVTTEEASGVVNNEAPLEAASVILKEEVQRMPVSTSIYKAEVVVPQIEIPVAPISYYEEAPRAPSTSVDPDVLGANVFKAAPLLESPWTLSFFGLVLAAAAALVIL